MITYSLLACLVFVNTLTEKALSVSLLYFITFTSMTLIWISDTVGCFQWTSLHKALHCANSVCVCVSVRVCDTAGSHVMQSHSLSPTHTFVTLVSLDIKWNSHTLAGVDLSHNVAVNQSNGSVTPDLPLGQIVRPWPIAAVFVLFNCFLHVSLNHSHLTGWVNLLRSWIITSGTTLSLCDLKKQVSQ